MPQGNFLTSWEHARRYPTFQLKMEADDRLIEENGRVAGSANTLGVPPSSGPCDRGRPAVSDRTAAHLEVEDLGSQSRVAHKKTRHPRADLGYFNFAGAGSSESGRLLAMRIRDSKR
jgi:hypothetical protein